MYLPGTIARLRHDSIIAAVVAIEMAHMLCQERLKRFYFRISRVQAMDETNRTNCDDSKHS